jgi:rifampicin phosphotransferase
MFSKTFQHISKDDANIAGGKGASLGEMINNNIPVPPGFVVLSSTFDKFLEITDINIEIDAILSKVRHNEIHTVENASKTIQALILSSEIPEEIAVEIKKEFKKLKTKYVAVRSSATAEDSASAAWAGQLDSFLNTTEDTLLENVKRCWASLFTPRAIFYRFEKELHKEKISVAVVIQKMVDSEVSGIAFSVHPVTEDRNQIIIEAGFGLGEAVVSGQVTPDAYVVTKDDLNILDKNVYAQERGIYRNKANNGNEWQDIEKTKGEKQCLNDEQIIELSKLIINIENHYNFPCDIEWAMEDDVFYIVQSRPITTLKNFDKLNKIYTPHGKLISSRARSKKVCPPFPAMFTQEYIGTLDMKRVYGLKAHATIYTWIGDDFTTATDSYDDVGVIGKMILNKHLSDKKWLDEIISWSEKQKNKLKNFIENDFPVDDLSSFSNRKIAKSYFEYCQKYRNFHLKNTPPWWIGAPVFEEELNNYVGRGDVSKEDLKILLEPLNYSFDLINEEKNIIKIAIKLKKFRNFCENNIPKEVDRLLNNHLKDYSSVPFGYVNGVVWDKNFFINKIKTIISEEDPLKLLREKNKKLNLKKIKQKKLFKKLKIDSRLKNIIEGIHKLGYLQDLKKIFQTRSHPHLQLVVLPEIAKRLNLDIKYMGHLTPHEIKDSLISGEVNRDLRGDLKKRIDNSIIISRNNKYEWIIGKDAINFAKKYDLLIFSENITSIKGNSASCGRVKGVAKICLSSIDVKKLNKGDVLVASMTTPDYISAMKISSAIITDEGGITCHAAVISRELNIPCIIGTKNATKVLNDGDEVEVDADNGVVRVLKRAKNTKKHCDEYELTFSRECVMATLQAWYLSENEKFLEHVQYNSPKKSYMFFEYTNSLARNYIDMNLVRSIYDFSLRMTLDDPEYFNHIEKSFWRKLKLISPYINGKKDIQTKEDFKTLFDNVTEVWGAYTISYWFSYYENQDMPEDIFQRSEKIRLKIETIIEDCNIIFTKGLRNIFGKKYIEEYKYLTIEELISGEIPSKDDLKQRSKFIIYSNGIQYHKSLANFLSKEGKCIEKIPYNEKEGLRGQTAYQGRVHGIVKVCLTSEEMGKVQEGDVVVSAMTTPNFLSAIKLSSAIITDEGGITCHAAIIAREMKKPCIIGTKIATQVLKDGDEVEVDADEGVARVLKRADEIVGEARGVNFFEKEGIIKFLKSNELDIQSAKASFFVCDLVFSTYAQIIKKEIGDFPVLVYVDGDNQFREIIAKDDVFKIGRYLYSRFEKGGIIEIKRMMRDHLAIEDSLASFENKKGKLSKVYGDFIEKFKEWWSYSLFLEDKGQFSYQKMGKLLSKRLGKEKSDRIISDLFCPSSVSVFSEERIFLYKICLEALRRPRIKEKILKNEVEALEKSSLKNKYEKYKEKYFYFKTDFYENKEMVFSDFISEIRSEMIQGDTESISSKINSIKEEFIISKNKMKSARSKLKKEELRIADYINHLMNWSDRRKIGMMKSLYYLFNFLKKISIEKNIKYDDLSLYKNDEIIDLLEKGSSLKLKRKGDLFASYYGDQSGLFLGDEALEIFRAVNSASSNKKKISGQIASRGRGGVFKGVARVINNPLGREFNKGDILVTTMTRIDFVPIMGIAQAIITDEGGVTSHAAIVSRELGIPCIIGTKIATQVLKDGDEVEVDADKGIVRILKRKKEK